MYEKFFDLTQKPFRLVPDPAYLFMGKSHEEALAHLMYAVSQGDGFVEITGEVGTGKTTLCRAFLENLDEKTEAAYIFNPKLDSVQLLKAINDEFSINSDADSTKDLIDILNAFLIRKRAEGVKVILIIDEAQNLSKEVLEQLRLLSNLETTQTKLLQIILVGQPELAEMLGSHELRQLGQRITLSCRISPLTYPETKKYIQHRLEIASHKTAVKFSRAALRSIYRYARGLPRLINISCDRTLLTAFGLNRHRITWGVTRTAIRELMARGDLDHYSFWAGKKAILLTAGLCLLAITVVLYPPGYLVNKPISETSVTKSQERFQITPPPTKKASEQAFVEAQVVTAEKTEEHRDLVFSEKDLEDYLKAMDTRSSRQAAINAVMDLWGAENPLRPFFHDIEKDRTFFQLAARQNGFQTRRVQGDIQLIRKLNLPAVLALYVPEGLNPVYLALTKIDGDQLTLRGGPRKEQILVQPDALRKYWSGVAFIPWKNFLRHDGEIPKYAPEDAIITLKILLRDIGFNDIEISPAYDVQTREAVKKIQQKHGLIPDGVVGSLTKIVLYNEKEALKIPHILE
jgi:general secretion pathway protein A